jgi:hypothetical protein
MPIKIRTSAVVLIFMMLASMVSISPLAQTSPPELPKKNNSAGPGSAGEGAVWQADSLISASQTIYLPLVAKNFAESPVPNGGFESGATIWAEFSKNGQSLILQESAMPVDAHGGSWAVWLGADHDEISYIEQTLTVPAAYPHFTYWHWIDSQDACGFDFAGVFVDGFLEDVYDLCSDNNTTGWESYSVDLSAYAGGALPVQI